MLSLKPIKSTQAAAKYFCQKDNYYLEGMEDKSLSAWFGRGAKSLGLDGEIKETVFEELLCGILPNGAVIGLQKDGTIKHRAGFDLTFSAPKSVAILALIGGDKRLIQLHTKAVDAALSKVEELCAQARISVDGKIGFENTKNLIISQFIHDTSRALDPLLHTHCIVANATQREDGNWRALASEKVKSTDREVNGFYERVLDNQLYLGMIYKAELASGLTELGYDIERVGKNGLFEIKGISKEVLTKFSKRREEIVHELEEKGLSSLKAADMATLATREEKHAIDRGQLRGVWEKEAAELGFFVKDFIKETTGYGVDKNEQVKDGIHPNEHTEQQEQKNQKNQKNQKEMPVPLVAKEIVNEAITDLSTFNVKLDYAKIAEKALALGIGQCTHRHIIRALDIAIQNKELIQLDHPALFTTHALIKAEKDLLTHVDKSKRAHHSIELTTKTINQIHLIEEQKDAIIDIAQAKSRLNLISHNGGDQKEFVAELFNTLERAGKTVQILTPTRTHANTLNETVQRKPKSLWQWLISQGKPDIGDSVAGYILKTEKKLAEPLWQLNKNKDVILVDSAQRLSTGDALKLLALTEQTQAKLIFLQDIGGHKGFLSGNPLEVMKKGGINTIKLNRQGKEEKKLMACIQEIKDEDARLKETAKQYVELNNKSQGDVLAIAGSKDRAKELNFAIREELKQQGALGHLEQTLSVYQNQNFSAAQKKAANQYRPNMILRFYDQAGEYQDWRVDKIFQKRNRLVLETADGKTRSHWNPRTARFITPGLIGLKEKGQDIKDVHVFTQEILSLSAGDKITATGHMRDLGIYGFNHYKGIRTGNGFVVEDITTKGIKLRQESADVQQKSRSITVPIAALANQHFCYSYAQTLSKATIEPKEHIVADMKAYALDQTAMNELSARAKQSLHVFTTDQAKANLRLSQTPQKITAIDTLLETAAPMNRIMSPHTIDAITIDIEKALLALTGKMNQSLAEKLAEKAVNFAIEKVTSRNAGFKHTSLVNEALIYALGEKTTPKEIEQTIKTKAMNGELVVGSYYNDGTRWTTKEALDLETAIIDRVKRGHHAVSPLINKELVIEHLKKTHLTTGQKNACYLMTTTADRFVMVQGYAGTGKTTMLREVKTLTQLKDMMPNGQSIYALAPTHQAVKELKAQGIEAQTLKSFLIEQNRAGAEITNNQAKEPLKNRIFVLDESSMVSNKDFDEFTAIIEENHSRAVLLGDRAQHLAIESGKPYEVLQAAKVIKIAYMSDIVRQQEPHLKKAVEHIIAGDFKKSFDLIEAQNPKDHIERTQHQEIFKDIQNSIIEGDVNSEDSKKPSLKEMVALDYLSRSVDTREKTSVIVHANEDREEINALIRSGLKDLGEISKTETMPCNRLVDKGLTHAELKEARFYKKGDIVKIGKDYLTVGAVDKTTKAITLLDVENKSRYFYPERHSPRSTVELYAHDKPDLAVGDGIRLRKTDKERGLLANTEYNIKSLLNGKITLTSKNKEQPDIVLNANELKDAHWDYAYTMTGYSAQGSTKPFIIDYEVSFRKNLANQRSFYIAQSRAKNHVIIYTDDKNKLHHRICDNAGDKYAALEIVGSINTKELRMRSDRGKNNDKNDKNDENDEKNSVAKEEYQSHKTLMPDDESKTNKTNKTHQIDKIKSYSFEVKEVEEALGNQVAYVIEELLGAPNQSLSNASSWRYGHKGSLSIMMAGDKTGLWHNFETGESGNLLKLIQNELGLNFKDALNYAAKIAGLSPHFRDEKKKTEKAQKTQKDKQDKSTNGQESQQKNTTTAYAKKLAKESLPMSHTLAERYLKEHRAIHSVDAKELRFHSGISVKTLVGKTPDGNPIYNYQKLPALLALAKNNSGEVERAQAIFLDEKTGAKANIDVNKRTFGQSFGSFVDLSDGKKKTGKSLTFITEGIETGMSVRDAAKSHQVIATLGKSNFKNIDLSRINDKVVFCLDNDGIKTLNDNIIHTAAKNMMGQGKDVYIVMPPEIKTDFNDIAKKDGAAKTGELLNAAESYNDWAKKCYDLLQREIKNPTSEINKISPELNDLFKNKMLQADFIKPIDPIKNNSEKFIAAEDSRMRQAIQKASQQIKEQQTTKTLNTIEKEIY